MTSRDMGSATRVCVRVCVCVYVRVHVCVCAHVCVCVSEPGERKNEVDKLVSNARSTTRCKATRLGPTKLPASLKGVCRLFSQSCTACHQTCCLS